MNDQPAPRRRRGLLTVVGWVAAGLVVAYVAWGVGTRQYHARRKAVCLHQLTSLAKAMRLYSLDYNEYMFFDRGDAFSPPAAPGQAGRTQYLREAMRNYLPRDPNVWYCPADPFAWQDLSSDPHWSGSFTYRESGAGYAAIPHAESDDPGIRELHSRLVRDYGADDMQVDHAFSSYRFFPSHHAKCEGQPAYIDNVVRCHRDEWGAYGHWDINPSGAWIFREDLPFHFTAGGLVRERIYGFTWGYRDGHAVFHTYPHRGITQTGELNEGW